jgi:hypothetical protein
MRLQPQTSCGNIRVNASFALPIAAIWSGAMVRNCLGASSVARLGDVQVGSVKIIFTSYADERE